MSGKGSKARPFSVTQEEYNNRWDAIFGRDLQKFDEAVFSNIQPEDSPLEEFISQNSKLLVENKNQV